VLRAKGLENRQENFVHLITSEGPTLLSPFSARSGPGDFMSMRLSQWSLEHTHAG
jgi:hypothetical protein